MVFRKGPEDDWVVADSEDEDSLDQLQSTRAGDVSAPVKIPDIFFIEAFTSIALPGLGTTVPDNNSISPFTYPAPQIASTSAIASVSPFPEEEESISASSKYSSSRPRPRPVFKGSKTTSDPASDTPAIQTPSSIFTHPPTIIVDPHIDAPARSGDTVLEDFSLDIAERAKMRSRKAAQHVLYRAEVIELSSEDEFTIEPTEPVSPPRTKAKAKPRPRPVKKSKVVQRSTENIPPPPPSVPDTIPVPSSSLNLPPSDFPLSSTAPRSSPPAVIGSSPIASPLRQRKRKRVEEPPMPSIAIVDDSIDYDAAARMPPPPAPPPPPFFATSSVPETLQDTVIPPSKPDEEPKKAKEKNKAKDAEGPKPKKKAKSTKDKEKSKAVVEVVIESPRKRKKAQAADDDYHEENTAPRAASSSSRPAPPSLADSDLSAVPNSDEDELQMLPPVKKGRKVPTPRPIKKVKGKEKAIPPADEDEEPAAPKARSKKRPGKRAMIMSDEEGESQEQGDVTATDNPQAKKDRPVGKVKEKENADGQSDEGGRPANRAKKARVDDEPETPARSKENVHPTSSEPPHIDEEDTPAPKPVITVKTPSSSISVNVANNNMTRRYTFARAKSTPMSELIRRAASHSTSPFPAKSPASASPLAKASKSMLRKIAPLHPNRKTPPPPPPRPPPPKKSKKMLEMEERWEMELEESVEGWWALNDEERKEWRRAKRDKELGFDD